jgi:predicted MFS family arabinose efflux permease
LSNNNAGNARAPGFLQGLFLLLPITLSVIGVSVFTATVNQMQEHFKYVPNGAYLVNLLQTMPGFWIVAFSPIAGWLADKFGRRNILLLCMVLYSIAGVAPFRMENIYAILFTRCLVGMCESVVMTVTTTMLCDYFKGRARERWLASQTGVASLSALAIIPLGGFLGAVFGWQGPFLVYSSSLILMIFVFIFCWEPPHEIAPPADEIQAIDHDARYQIMPWPRMIGIMLITVIASLMFYSTVTQNANALVELGIRNPADIGSYSTLASFGVPIGTLLFWGLGRLHIGLLLFIDFLLIGIGFTWMAAAKDPGAYVLAANVQQIGCGLILPTMLVWATRGLAYRIRGFGNGLWQGAFGFGLFVSGFTLQFMGSILNNSILGAFGVLGKFCLAAAIVTLVAKLIWGKQALPHNPHETPALH